MILVGIRFCVGIWAITRTSTQKSPFKILELSRTLLFEEEYHGRKSFMSTRHILFGLKLVNRGVRSYSSFRECSNWCVAAVIAAVYSDHDYNHDKLDLEKLTTLIRIAYDDVYLSDLLPYSYTIKSYLSSPFTQKTASLEITILGFILFTDYDKNLYHVL